MLSLLSLKAIMVWLAVANAQDQALLSTIASIPELSTFSTVVLASGGNQPNPAFEERFNSALDGRNYTAVVPTNDAFAKISPDLVGALVAAPAYPILESILRTHIAEGLVTSADIISASPVEAIEGFTLTVTDAGGGLFVNSQAELVAVDTPASNGIIHQIDQVLNPFTGYFGISNANSATAPPSSNQAGTIADIVLSDERLTTLSEILLTLQPDFLNSRLRLFSPADTAPQLFIAPSNTAFDAAPPGTAEASLSPSNQQLSFLLYSFGLLDSTALTSDVTSLADLGSAAGAAAQLTSAFTGINITASQSPGGVVTVNNAVVEAEVCGSNGCVVLVDRVLDPLYLAFGPVDRLADDSCDS